jgi:fimbrial chaperone protein
MKAFLPIVVAALVVPLLARPARAAYQIEPISRVFAPSGARATQSFEVVNSGSDRIALTISFATLERDELYVETNRDAEDEFLAYPAQMILAPGVRQTVRVTWLGTPNPTRELAYRIVVSQVPLEQLDRTAAPSDQPQGRMRVMLNYRGTLFIRPPNAAPRVELNRVELATAAGLVKSCTMRVISTRGGSEIALSPAVLAALRNTRVLGGGRRRYLVPWPAELLPGPVRASGQCTVAP